MLAETQGGDNPQSSFIRLPFPSLAAAACLSLQHRPLVVF